MPDTLLRLAVRPVDTMHKGINELQGTQDKLLDRIHRQ